MAIVRLSGPRTRAAGEALLGGPLPAPRQAAVRRARDPASGLPIDEVLALWMPAPGSYTRQDVLELQCHGGAAAARGILRAALGAGARLAEPGEFTLRAYLGGRIDLVQAEAVLDVIRAQSEEALAVQEGLLAGSLSAEATRWQEALGGALARIEATLDFPEEDLGPLAVGDVRRTLAEVAAAMGAALASHAWGRVTREGFRVALVGSPNVGKSSLLNLVAQGEHAIVSPVPGTTRDPVEVAVTVCGVPMRIVDTAGLRTPGDEVEREGVRRARQRAAEADRIVFVCDGSRGLTIEEMAEARGLAEGGRTAAVVSKGDLGREPAAGLEEIFGRAPLVVSAATGLGLAGLLDALAAAARGGGGPTGSGVLTRERHRGAVEAAKAAVEGAQAHLGGEGFLELAGSGLRDARRALEDLLGRGAGEDVLDRIFGEFCIGK